MVQNRKKLLLEQLEDRWCPALTIRYTGGNLFVTGNPVGVVLVNNSAATNYTVTDGANNLGTYNVTGNMSITTSNASDVLTVAILATSSIPGSLTINTGNGGDTVTITGNGTGAVSGNLFVNTGFGTDILNIGTVSAVRVAGVAVLNGDAGLDTVNIDGAGASSSIFSSDVSIQRFNVATANDTTFHGVLSVINQTDTAIANSLTLGATTPVTVNGSLNYVGGADGDTVILNGVYLGTTSASANVYAADGANDIRLGENNNSTFNGSVTYTGGSGTDSVTLGASNVTVAGSLTLGMGDGNNAYDLDQTTFTVFGSLALNAGNGNDNIGNFMGTVFGNAAFNMGHGANTLNFGNGAGVGGVLNGGSTTYSGGSGVDSVTVNQANNAFNLNVYLGAGADTFTYRDVATMTMGSATIDGGIDADTDSYVQGATVIVNWPQVLRNFL